MQAVRTPSLRVLHVSHLTSLRHSLGYARNPVKMPSPLNSTSSPTLFSKSVLGTYYSQRRDDKMPRGSKVLEMKDVLKKADAVCFDVDSTVCRDEAIDELAVYCGVGEDIKQM